MALKQLWNKSSDRTNSFSSQVLYLERVSVQVNHEVSLCKAEGAEKRYVPHDVNSFPIKQKQLKKFYVAVAPFCQCNGQPQGCTLRHDFWFSDSSLVHQGSAHLSPFAHTCLAFLTLEISVCVWSRMAAFNPESFSQNRIPLFHLSGVICPSGKQWLLCMIHLCL